jgi:hypothetical protein
MVWAMQVSDALLTEAAVEHGRRGDLVHGDPR